MSKNILLSAMVAAMVGLGAVPKAEAHEGPGGPMGIGIGVGAPTGLSLELSSGWRSSFELAVGFDPFDGVGGYAHLVFKGSLFDFARGSTAIVPLYLGLGMFAIDQDGFPDDNLDLGVRVPLGVNFDFQRAPVQLFLEGALLATVVDFGENRDGWFGVGGYGGVRLWF